MKRVNMRTLAAAAGVVRCVITLALFTGLSAAPPALACGHCIEDKIAACYDHALMSRAFARKHQVAFFALDGPLAGSSLERRAITLLAGGARGVEADSVRLSIETASLAVVFDPARVKLSAVQQEIEARLKSRGLTLLPLQVMDRPPGGKLAR